MCAHVCVYSLHFTAAWVKRREVGGGGGGTGCVRKGGGDDCEWMFLGKERRRNQVEVGSADATRANKGRFCSHFHEFSNFVYFFFIK